MAAMPAASVAVGVSEAGAAAPIVGVVLAARTSKMARAVVSGWPATEATISTPQGPARGKSAVA